MNNFGSNEYNFDSAGKRNSALEKYQLGKDKNENNVKHQSTKTNINMNYDNGKILILELKTENHEIKDELIITSSGLKGSKRTKTDNNDDDSIYFGSKDLEEDPVNYTYIYIILFYRMEKLIIIYLLISPNKGKLKIIIIIVI